MQKLRHWPNHKDVRMNENPRRNAGANRYRYDVVMFLSRSGAFEAGSGTWTELTHSDDIFVTNENRP